MRVVLLAVKTGHPEAAVTVVLSGWLTVEQ